jgi:hypothetical protein
MQMMIGIIKDSTGSPCCFFYFPGLVFSPSNQKVQPVKFVKISRFMPKTN